MRKLVVFALHSICFTGCFQQKVSEFTKPETSAPVKKHFLEYVVPREAYTPGVYDGNPEPPYPDLNDDVKTLEGIDADNDGLRDDLEIWINRKSKNENERNLWRMYVRFYTDTIASEQTDEEKGLQTLTGDQIAVACGELLFAEARSEMFEKKSLLIGWILNTKKREFFYTNASNEASPFHGEFATNKEILLMSRCFCRFEIKDKQNVMERYQAYQKIFVNLTEEKINFYLEDFKVRNERGYYEKFFGITDYKSCLDIETK